MELWDYKTITPRVISCATDKCLHQVREILDEILAPKDALPTATDTLVPLNEMDILTSNIIGRLYMLTNLHPVKRVRRSAERNYQKLVTFKAALSLNPELYDVIFRTQLTDGDVDTQRFRCQTLHDFARQGADQDEKARAKILDLSSELIQLGMEFDRNINESVNEIEAKEHELRGIPDAVIASFERRDDTYIITTHYPHAYPVLQFCKDEKLRERMARAMATRAPENTAILDRILEKRHEVARLLKYANWADYIAETSMAGSGDQIEDFLVALNEDMGPSVDREINLLRKVMEKDGLNTDFPSSWNQLYYTEQLKQARGYDPQEFMAYFPYIQVEAGIMEIYSDLFGIEFIRNDTVAVWHRSVKCYDVTENDRLIGRIYLDMHPRDGKYGHAACGVLTQGIEDRQVSESYLMCNFAGGKKSDGHALMQFAQVEVFFHEFGHLLHNIFSGKKKWARFSGIESGGAALVEFDFLETPSQLLEAWLFEPQVLRRIGRHHKTGQPISESLVEQLRTEEQFGKALYAQRIVFLGAVSLAIHTRQESVADIWAEAEEKYWPFPYPQGTHFWTGWTHLNNYSSNYYVYLWALAIARDVLTGFDENNLMNKEIAQKYRETILEPTGSRSAAVMVQDFLGRPYNFDAFRKWIEN